MNDKISIVSIHSISPLGSTLEEVWRNYNNDDHFLIRKKMGESKEWMATLPKEIKHKVADLSTSDSNYKDLDNTVLYALIAARGAIKEAGWKKGDDFGINIGSSRGATTLFEKYYDDFLKEGKATTLVSPTTTLGNISSWVANDLQTKGPEISHSITCSTALHALLNGMAWLKSGMATKFLVGGSEAPLTPFTIAQMKAMRIYSTGDSIYPCKAMDLTKVQNSMVLGEAASMACLEIGENENSLATIEGVGYATEPLEHNISISAEAICFQRSMQMALGQNSPEEVDVIVMHAPGTIKGDVSERKAIETIFCNKTPLLTTNKWKVGHTFGASGMLSLEMAILMLRHQKYIGTPFNPNEEAPKTIDKIMVNAVGFGGNAVSVLLSR